MYKRPRGTRDFLPEEMRVRRWIFERIREVIEGYGYGEVCTPAIEDLGLLTKKSGEEIEQEIYSFEDKGGRKLGLRFDLTVGNARIVAANPDLPKPIKWYSIGRMWRYDKPQTGRYREFWQANLEIFGSARAEADAEVLAVVYDSLRAIGIKGFILRVNSRGIIEELAKKADIPAKKKKDAFRAADKLGKMGVGGVRKEMERYGIDRNSAQNFINLIRLKPRELESVLGEGKELEEIKNIIRIAKKMGVNNICLDQSIARGIDYYTGFVFETVVKGFERLGSVASGGRYDSLVALYGGKNTPAVGAGIGLDRLAEIVKIPSPNPKIIFILPVNDKVRPMAWEIAKTLRRGGITAEIDLMGRSLSKQLAYCDIKGVEAVCIVGERELKKRSVIYRDMQTGEEKLIKIKDLIKEAKST